MQELLEIETLPFHTELKVQNASNVTDHTRPNITINLLGATRLILRPTHQDLKQNRVNHVLTHSNA